MIELGTMKEWAGIAITLVIILFGYFIEISKIKINPISFIFKTIGTAFNQPTLRFIMEHEQQQKLDMANFNQSLEEIMNEIKKLTIESKINELKRTRSDIMAFSMSCKRKEDHNEQQFQMIIQLHTDYENIIKELNNLGNPITNGVLDEDYDFIMQTYRQCRDSGKFYTGDCYM